MTVREATEDDLETMAILWRMMVKEISPESSEMNAEWWMQYQREMIKTSTYRAYVAFCQDVMVGYIVGLLYPDAIAGKMIAFGHDFYIMPEFRSKQLSSILYGKLVRLGKHRGAEVIEMSCFEGQLEMWGKKGYKVERYLMRRSI
jgi:GNAT superfamily N-acetyltransferase